MSRSSSALRRAWWACLWLAAPVALAEPVTPAVSIEARVLPRAGAHVLVGAGDIADCSGAADRTARVVEKILTSSANAHAFTAGDNAYPSGTADNFRRCYAPTWGRFRDRTVPVAGNHDWMTPGAAGYFGYFGARAGTPAAPWRSFVAGSWRVFLLDSDCQEVGGCGPGSPQAAWLARELGDPLRRTPCSVAIWHHPRFSSGPHGSDARTEHLWRLLQDAGAELVVTGHDHTYERFAALRHDGGVGAGGLVSFVVGTGGRAAYPFGGAARGSVARLTDVVGVLVLHLDDDGYRAFFVDADGRVRDEARGACHGP